MSEMIERVARALMGVRARLPGYGPELPVLALDPDFDDLPRDHSEGTESDDITQEAVRALASAAIEAMREPTTEMVRAATVEPLDKYVTPNHAAIVWQLMVYEALK